MKKVRITVMRKAEHQDLMQQYENPIEHACDLAVGQVFLVIDGERPKGFCLSAWETLSPFVAVLSQGGGNFYDGWMKDPYTAMLSCNDGFRPVSFLLEAFPEEN